MKIGRRRFLKLTSLVVLGSLGRNSTAAPTQTKPNIILINVDDLGWTDVACFGSRYYETPNIDRLAKEGMKFTEAYAACAVCSPTRAAIMTGRYPARVGVTDWIHFADPEAAESVARGANPTKYVGTNEEVLCPPNPYWMEKEEVTLAEVLGKAGYVCCHVGKWHLGPEPWYPERQGFDFNFGGCDFGQPPSYFDPYYRNAARPSIPTLPPRKEGEYLTDRENDEALSFMRRHRDKPFFLNMCHYAVHTPIQGKPELVEKYQAKKATKQKNPEYAAMVESVDNAVGRLMKELDDLKLADRTMVIFTSDNGGLIPTSTDNSPLRLGKGYPYEGGIRIPQIIRWPGVVQPGRVTNVPVCSIDFFPTICSSVGIDLPGGREIDGVDLSPVLEGKGSLQREDLFWHFPHYRGEIEPYSIIRSGEWKLIRRYAGKRFELFNLKQDLGEQKDLSLELPDRVEELDRKLRRWLDSCGAKLPRPNPDYRPPA